MIISTSPAAVSIRKKKYLRVFRKAGAINEKSAKSLEDLKLHNSLIFRRMVTRGIFVQTGDSRYYLNQPVAEVYENNRKYYARIILLIVILIVLAIIIGVLSN